MHVLFGNEKAILTSLLNGSGGILMMIGDDLLNGLGQCSVCCVQYATMIHKGGVGTI